MAVFHTELTVIGNEKVIRIEDYSVGVNGLLKSNEQKYLTETDSLVICKSGTELKLKIYI